MKTMMHDGERWVQDYDWVLEGSTRTPEQYPYGFDAHYLWRLFDKNVFPTGTRTTIYTDRMQEWDPAKYAAAIDPNSTEFGKLSKGFSVFQAYAPDAQIVVKRYFGENVACVGFAIACNVSNGYPLGIFILEDLNPKEPANGNA